MTKTSRRGVVLCGGLSSRMGRPKHLLELNGRTFLDCCLDALKGVVDHILISISVGQSLSHLPANISVIADEHAEGSGPLAGLSAVLQRMGDEPTVVLSCDAPLIKPAILQLLFEAVDTKDVAYSMLSGREQFFPGVYRRKAGEVAKRLLSRGDHRMSALIAECDCSVVPEDQIRVIDPDLESFLNVNTSQDYEVILQRLKGN